MALITRRWNRLQPPHFGPTVGRYLSAFRSVKGVVGMIILALLVAIAVLAPVAFPGGYDQQSPEALAGVSAAHPFGTDELGRDVFVRSMYGVRTSLSLVLAAVPLSMVLGTLIGLLGVISERLGAGAQRLLDIILGFPTLILGICIVLVLGTGWFALFVSIVIIGLPAFGRLARATFLAHQEREYVLAAKVLGVNRTTIMVRHILPNAMDPILVQAGILMLLGIFVEAGLSIVGLGIQAPEPSLGTLLNIGMRYITQAPAYILGPTLVLFVLGLGLTLLTDALNEAVNRQ